MEEPKSAIHHWWPRVVSQHWKGNDGYVGAIRSDNGHFRTQHGKLGGIKNAHMLKLGAEGQSSPFDHSFEKIYDDSDANFPRIIKEIKAIAKMWMETSPPVDTFQPVLASPWLEKKLAQSLASLCLRGPMNRFMALDTAMRMRNGQISPREQKAIIGHNIMFSLEEYTQHMSGRGKVGLLISPDREFIYGDGFYHTLTSQANINIFAKMIVPLTPQISIAYIMPSKYQPEPMFFASQISSNVTVQLNQAVEIYAKNELLYSNEHPEPSDYFYANKHLEYEDYNNPATHIIRQIPGVIEL